MVGRHSLRRGRPNQGIADELVVTLDTVKKHVGQVLAKLGAANRTEAVARARELSLAQAWRLGHNARRARMWAWCAHHCPFGNF